MQNWLRLVVPLMGGLLVCRTSMASSPDAWQAFRAEVAAACMQAAGDEIQNPVVTVDPFGSPSYGLAVVCGQMVPDGAVVYRICVFHKRSRHVELGGGISAFAGGCSINRAVAR